MKELLTPREKEVADLLVLGYTNPEVAEELTISVRTVDTHRTNIYDKLHIHSRKELVELIGTVYKETLIVIPESYADLEVTIMIGE